MLARAAAALLCAAVGAAAAAPSARDFDSRRRVLDFGLWNNRINALYDAGELGRAGLPLLIYASDDADWQVRLTAVHFMGKLGAPAARSLGEIARAEPCPRVRVSALRWLNGMGPAGRRILDAVMTPEDEREMESLPDRYGTEKMGKPLVIDAPDGAMTAAFFDHGVDFRVCASSEYANRRKRQAEETPVVEAAEPDAAPVPEELPAAPPARNVAIIELEEPSGPRRTPETLPPAGPGLEPRADWLPEGRFAEVPGRKSAFEAPRTPAGAAETLPAAGPGLHREGPDPGEAGLVDDAGTGKPESDPIPTLIGRLASAEPRARARAADELGKRGNAALPAVPALRRALRDPDRRVRASAVLALGGVGSSVDGVIGELRRALRDKNEDVRFSAVIALQRLK